MSKEGDSKARPILVPVDFSRHSVAALDWAADLARRIGARIHVLHVVHDPEDQPGYYHQPEEDSNWSVEATAGKMLEEFLLRCRTEVPALALLAGGLMDNGTASDDTEHLTRELIIGVPVRRILEVAQRVDARLIVMGSHGRTGLSRLLLGSKAQSVVQLAPMPVTIVKAPAGSQP
jgi:nucleotide-binding universal stress UspA family protein